MEAIYLAPDWELDDGLLYQSTFWDLIPYGNWMILNWGQGQAQVWKEGLGVGTLGTVYSDVVTFAKMADFLVAIGFGGARTRVGWSSSGDIEDWVPTDINEADSMTLAEFDTPIRAAAKLGDSTAIFSEDQLAVLNFVGTPFWFGYKFKLDGIGACGKKSVAGDGKNIVGVGRNGIWWTDGLTSRYIDEGYLHDYLQENVNWGQQGKITAARNDVTGCFDFCFPMGVGTSPSEAWSFDPRVGGGWHQVPHFSLKDERRLFRKPIWGDLDGQILLDMDADTSNVLDLRTKPLLGQIQDSTKTASGTGLMDIHQNTHVQEVDFFLKEAENVEFRVGAAQAVEAEYVYTPWKALVVGTPTYLMPTVYRAGVYHRVEFRSTAADWSLDLQGFEMFGKLEGTKR
jgi:hypothetical protein